MVGSHQSHKVRDGVVGRAEAPGDAGDGAVEGPDHPARPGIGPGEGVCGPAHSSVHVVPCEFETLCTYDFHRNRDERRGEPPSGC